MAPLFCLSDQVPSCGVLIGSSEQAGSATEIMDVSKVDSGGSDDSFDYWIEVRWFSGNSCSNWTLQVEGNAVP